MAYAIPLHTDCTVTPCNVAAEFIVYDSHNLQLGNYCSKHTSEKIKMLKAQEQNVKPSVWKGQHDAVRERLRS